jgi:tetratricopeptide (TPR) repeat protein
MALPGSPASSRSFFTLALVVLVAGSSSACASAGGPRVPGPDQIPSLERSAAANPADVDVRVRLGAAYRAAGRLDDAQRVLEGAYAVDPTSSEVVSVLGLVYDDAGADSSAVAMYRKYLDENPRGSLRGEIERRLELVRRRALQASVTAALQRESELASTPPEPRTVGVFPFQYRGPDQRLRPLGRALAEMLTTDLAQSSRLRVLERLRVQLLVDEMALAGQGRVDPATAARSGRLLGAGRVVQGVLDGDESQLIMEAVVVPVGDSVPPAGQPVSERDPAQRFFDMENQMALGLFQEMGIELTPAEREAVMHQPTQNLDALLAFGLGLEAQDGGRYQDAATFFQQAQRLDPGFTAAGAALQQTQSLIVAEGMDLGSLVGSELAAVPAVTNAATNAYEQWQTRLTSFSDIEGLLPGILGRDPVPEILGHEGVETSGSFIEIIIRRPGGDQ